MGFWNNFRNRLPGLYTDEALEYEALVNPYRDTLRNITGVQTQTTAFNEWLKALKSDKKIQDELLTEFYAPLELIANKIGEMDLLIYKNFDKKELVENNSPLNIVFNKQTNYKENAFVFKRNLVMYMLLYGKVYAVPNTNIETNKAEYIIIPHNKIVELENGDILVGEDAKLVNDKNINNHLDKLNLYALSDIIKLESDLFCNSKLDYLMSDLNMILPNKKAIYNSLNKPIKLIASTQNQNAFSRKEVEKMFKSVEDALNSAQSNLIPIAGFENINVIQRNIDTLKEYQKDLSARITNYLGVPAGLLDGSSNKGKKELIDLLYSKTLSPIITQIEKELGSKTNLNYVFKFNTKQLFSIDQIILTDVLTKQIEAGIITIDEARLELGYSPIETKISSEPLPKLWFNIDVKEVNNGTTNTEKSRTAQLE